MSEWIITESEEYANVRNMIPLVRCRDCENFSKFDNPDEIGFDGVCDLHGTTSYSDWFCADGVKDN